MQASTKVDLKILARLLQRADMPTQQEIAKECKVDQGFVSRAQAGDLKRITRRVRRLWSYVNMRKGDLKIPANLRHAVEAYLLAGGDPTLLEKQIDLLLAMSHRS